MKKFLLRTLVAFALIFVFLFSITMFLEYKNKDDLQSKFKVEIELEDNGDIKVPEEPAKVTANYKFSKVYYFSGLTISIIIPLLFYCYDGIGVIKRRKFKVKVLEGGALCILYSIFEIVLMFPKILFSAFYRARLMGLSSESFMDFFKRFFIGNGLNLLISLPILVLIYVIFFRFKRWYFVAGAILVLVSLTGSYIYPYIDEEQNNLVEMEEGELRDKIIEISKEAGIESLEVMVIPKESETSSMNAYMTGIGDSRRIVFWDTTINGLGEKEILSIAAHEIGHYKLNHIPKSILISALTTVLSLLLLHNIMRRLKGCDYRVIDNIPKMLFIMNLIGLLIAPLESAYSRKMEVEADTFAMEITNDGYTNGALEIRFIESNLTPIDPKGLYKWLAYDHPTVKERIELSNQFNIR